MFTKTRASRESASRACRPQTRLGVTTATTATLVAARVANETKTRNARHDESAAFSDMHRPRRASDDFVVASSSRPPVSEAANEFVEFFSPLAETTHSHCVKATIDVDDAHDCGRDGAAAVASRALLFTDDNEMERFLNAERRQRLEEEERDEQTLIELHRDLVKASTSRRRRTHRAVMSGAAWLLEEEGQPSTSVAAAPQPQSSARAHADPTRCHVPMRNCSSCKHDFPAATHFYSDRKTCIACLRYHLRYSRRKRKREKMEHAAS